MTPILHSPLNLCCFPCNSAPPFNCVCAHTGKGEARFPAPEFGRDLMGPTERNRNVTEKAPSLGLKKTRDLVCFYFLCSASAMALKRSWSSWTGSSLGPGVGYETCGTKPQTAYSHTGAKGSHARPRSGEPLRHISFLLHVTEVL